MDAFRDLPPASKLHVLSFLDAGTREKALSGSPDTKLPRVELLRHLSPHSELSVFSRPELERLEATGYFVRDFFLAKEGAVDMGSLYMEVNELFDGGSLRAANMNRAEAKWGDKSIRGDQLMWLNDREDLGSHCPALARVLDAMVDLQHEFNRLCAFESQNVQIQLACYPGGGARYVRHLDAFKGGPNRRITVVYYINPNWVAGDGGCLRVYPEEGDPEDIDPLADRVVVFQSRRLEHEVLPSAARRFAVTCWFY